MLTFFTDPYDNEILSSTFARYHFYIGNINKKDTLEELLGEREIRAFKIFPSRLNYIERKLYNYKADYFIYNHTIFPIYSPFIIKERQDIVIEHMKNKGCGKISHILGLSTSKLEKRKWYMYCPLCAKEDFEKRGESFFNRLHQIQGVLICGEHRCRLNEYKLKEESDKDFVMLDYNKVNNDNINYYSNKITNELMEISKAIKYIINLPYISWNRDKVTERYKEILDENGYLTKNGVVRQTKLILDFNNYYDNELLELLKSSVSIKEKYGWIKRLFRDKKSTVEPIRNILFIIFLTKNRLDKFFSTPEKLSPFGRGPWPCLNPVCPNYRQKVIFECEIEDAYRSRIPNGIFKCQCGYTYRRKWSDKNINDIFKKNHILQFGELWEEKFKEAIKRGDKNKDIIKVFGVYDEFISKYKKNGKFTRRDNKTNLGNIKNNFEEYTNNIIEFIERNKDLSRSDIVRGMKKQVSWLRLNNPEWLENNLPKAQKSKGYKHKYKYDELDISILKELQDEYEKIILEKRRVRITITYLEKTLNMKIYRKLDKLPKTKKYLSQILESVDEFRIRRVKTFCENKSNIIRNLNRTEILIKNSIIVNKLSNECKKEINDIIAKYIKKANSIVNLD